MALAIQGVMMLNGDAGKFCGFGLFLLTLNINQFLTVVQLGSTAVLRLTVKSDYEHSLTVLFLIYGVKTSITLITNCLFFSTGLNESQSGTFTAFWS